MFLALISNNKIDRRFSVTITGKYKYKYNSRFLDSVLVNGFNYFITLYAHCEKILFTVRL